MTTRTVLQSGLVAVFFVAGGMVPSSADILQEQYNQSIYWGFGSTRGQTFLPDTSVSTITAIDFYYASGNTSLPPARPTVLIYEGEGFGGSVVDSAVSPLIPSDALDGWISVPFNNTPVTPGQRYTFQLSQPTGAAGGCMLWGDDSVDVYPDGEHLDDSGGKLTSAFFDNAFRIHGVPEPASLGLVCSGLLCAFLLRSCKRNLRV